MENVTKTNDTVPLACPAGSSSIQTKYEEKGIMRICINRNTAPKKRRIGPIIRNSRFLYERIEITCKRSAKVTIIYNGPRARSRI
jgi:hypothetical protein